MAHKKPVILTVAKAPRPVQWAIAFHAWLLTWLPESDFDREVIAVMFEEQCLEAYQVGLGWWLDVVIWAWGDVGVIAGLTRFSEFRQKFWEQKDLEDKEYINILSLILSIILTFFVNIPSIISFFIIITSLILIIILIISIRKKRNL